MTPVKAGGPSFLSRLLQASQVNRAVVFGVLAKIWGSASALVTILLIASRFTPAVQGYYYTFGNLLALQVFAELGLGYVIIQFASHEWSQLGFAADGRPSGVPAALSRLISLSKLAARWYAVSGVVIAVGLGFAGYIFFSRSPSQQVSWQMPWLALCVITGINVSLVPLWSLLEGCNQVANVYLYRFVNGIVMGVTLWLAIALGSGLWAQPLAALVSVVWSGVFLISRYSTFFRSLLLASDGPHIDWRSEIWPMQWRIAVSWMSGYLTFFLFTPVIFRIMGPVVAGRAGMTLALSNALSAVASMWVFSRAPQFGILIARREYAELDRLFAQVAMVSIAVACVGGAVVWEAVHWLYSHGHPFAQRMLPPVPTGLFLLASVAMQIPFAAAVYLRAHKREPFLVVSVLQGILTAVSTVVLGQRFGIMGIALGNLAVVTLVIVPLGIVIWYQCRYAWHPGAPRPWWVVA